MDHFELQKLQAEFLCEEVQLKRFVPENLLYGLALCDHIKKFCIDVINRTKTGSHCMGTVYLC